MWLATTFAFVFLGFLCTTATTAAGLTWAARQGSWRSAAYAAAAGIAIAVDFGRVIVARVPFAWTYLPDIAIWWIITILAAGGAGALWIRYRNEGAPVRSFRGALLVMCIVWLPLASIAAAGSGCSLDAQCY